MNHWSRFSWSKTCIELAAGASLALLLYLITMNLVVSKSLLFSLDTRRIIEVQKFCSSIKPVFKQEVNFIIGSSVAVEGIDAELVDQTLGESSRTYNLGIVGLTPVEALMLEPAVKAGNPQLVVIGIDAMSLGVDKTGNHDKEEIDFEKLQAYRATNTLGQMEASVKKELLENILLPKEKAILESDYLSYLVGCRSLPIFFTESKFRELTRKELRTQEVVTNFKSPWMLKTNLTGAPKERIVNNTATVAEQLRFDEHSRKIKALRLLTRVLRAENIAFILVVWPLHPRVFDTLPAELINQMQTLLNDITQTNNGIHRNYARLLSEGDFADALHPNSQGRMKLSMKLAGDMKAFSAHLNTP